ncbi:MAG: uridylate kinase [Isosphaeraceae bacterium]|nr:uridylate kinase [Isosphaeraceae bacterium]
MSTLGPVVLKVGGSLLDWPDLPRSLRRYLADRQRDRLVLIVGGGRAADWVRDLDRWHGLGEECSHELALRALDLTAYLLAALVPGLEVVTRLEEVAPAWATSLIPILAPRLVLEADDRKSVDPLPHTWEVTTDAIAARIAARLDADELVLLKSTPLPPGTDRAGAARLGLVDPAFGRASRTLRRVTYLNLRDANATPAPL